MNEEQLSTIGMVWFIFILFQVMFVSVGLAIAAHFERVDIVLATLFIPIVNAGLLLFMQLAGSGII